MTRLAGVTDLSPILLSLSLENISLDKVSSLLVVKIRSTLLHILVNNRLWCVVISKVRITDVTDYCRHNANGVCQILISTENGDIWLVTLPKQFQPAMGCVVTKLFLERSSDQNNDGGVRWIGLVPGVLSVLHTPADNGVLSLTLFRSMVTPTTLYVNTCETLERQMPSHQLIELDDIEGEQATCNLCLIGRVVSHTGLLCGLFPDVVNDSNVAAILQGDLDCCVRFALIRFSNANGDCANASVIRSETLLRLREPIQAIIPFCTSSPRSNEDIATVDSQQFDALLVLSVRGRIGVISTKDRRALETFPVAVNTLELGRSVQSIVFVHSLRVFIFCSSGSAFMFRSIDLLAKAELANSNAVPASTTRCTLPTKKLPLQSGIIHLAIHGRNGGMSILFASGRTTHFDKKALNDLVTSILPCFEREHVPNRGHTAAVEKLSSESQIRELVHRIAQVTAESSDLRTKSKQMDVYLKALHSALEILRAVGAAGVESVVNSEIRANVVKTGTFLDRHTIQLTCSLRFVDSDPSISLDEWSLCLYVRALDREVTSYSFPLKNIAAHGKQRILLDPDTLAQQDQGFLWVSCSMVFCLSLDGISCHQHPQTSSIDSQAIHKDNLLAFAIPLIQNKRFLLAQLSQPIEDEMSARQGEIHAAFCQRHVPFMPVGKTETQMSNLWAGVHSWAALADHAQKTPSFAALWSKIASSNVAMAPPSRFVVTIPSFFDTEDDENEDDGEDEKFETNCIERMVSFLRQLLDTPTCDIPRLRRSCRTQHGSLWTMLQAFSGSLVLLRFTPSEIEPQSVDLTIQCSDVADLSAMRALVLDIINKWSSGDLNRLSEADYPDKVYLDYSEMAEPIAVLEKLMEDLALKITTFEDPRSSTCTDDVLHALSQLAHLETQTFALYWKSRAHINMANL
ncbi:hypothetical protein Plhal710r2_c002g0006811 [Plasmopara halstedii]